MISPLSPRKFAIRTWLCNCQQYFCFLELLLSASQFQIDFFVKYFPHPVKILFLSSQFLCHPHTKTRIILSHDVQRDIPNLEFSPSHVSIEFSRIAFPIIVLPKDDHTDSAPEERLGLPYWTMILATCVVVDESKCLDTPIWEFFKKNVSIFHFHLGTTSLNCVCCLSAIWR